MKVSILTLAYNHERFIKQCLESIVVQETDFDFEVLVHDDASSDGTVEVIREVSERYDVPVRLVEQQENQYSLGRRNLLFRNLWHLASGEYIALCEGDDYWTDPHKLQKQVELMDNNPSLALCFHPVELVGEGKGRFPEGADQSQFTLQSLAERNFIQTNSVLYRRLESYDDFSTRDFTPGDWYLHLFHARAGDIAFIDETMAAYRIHDQGVWYGAKQDADSFWIVNGPFQLALYEELLKLFADDVDLIASISQNLHGAMSRLESLDAEDPSWLQSKISDYPVASEALLRWRSESLATQSEDFDFLQQQLTNLEGENKRQLEDIEQLQTLLRNRVADVESLRDVVKDQRLKNEHLVAEIADLQSTMAHQSEILNSILDSKPWAFRNRLASLTGRQVIDGRSVRDGEEW